MSNFSRTKQIKAARVYQCDGCHMAIEVGEVHTYQTGVYDGDFYSIRNCEVCQDLWECIYAVNDYGEEFGALSDEVSADPTWEKRWNENKASRRSYKEAKQRAIEYVQSQGGGK